MASLKLGRLPRTRNPRTPHLSALLAGLQLPDIPETQDWARGTPDYLGMMVNDQLGDCTCAAIGHAEQIWTFNASGAMNTISDADVIDIYRGACGYIPGNPNSDVGGNEQLVLRWVQQNGIPGSQGKIDAWVEVDPRHHQDISRVIYDCGLCYLGFNVPTDLMNAANPPPIWDFHGDFNFEGGHAIIATGYSPDGLEIVSWGSKYLMTWKFWDAYVDEAYGIVSTDWVKSIASNAPSNLNIAQMVAELNAIKEINAN